MNLQDAFSTLEPYNTYETCQPVPHTGLAFFPYSENKICVPKGKYFIFFSWKVQLRGLFMDGLHCICICFLLVSFAGASPSTPLHCEKQQRLLRVNVHVKLQRGLGTHFSESPWQKNFSVKKAPN